MSDCSTNSSSTPNEEFALPMENSSKEQQSNNSSSEDDSADDNEDGQFMEDEEERQEKLPHTPTNEYEEDEDLINLDNNDLNYYEDEEHSKNTESESRLPYSPEQTHESDDKMSKISNSDDEHENVKKELSDLMHDDLQHTNTNDLDEIHGEEISSADELDDQDDGDDAGEEGELTDGENVKEKENNGEGEANAHEEPEDLEDGEIRSDSDDGIPEIKGGLSPPMMPTHSSHINQSHDIASVNHFSSTSVLQNQQQISRYQHVEKEREVCRFFLRGNCKNGEVCRFRHTIDARARIQQNALTTSNLPVKEPNYYTKIPPPMGPPIPLLSKEIAPPCPLPTAPFRPSAPVNTDSAAWEQGLKKAREMVRRQKVDQHSDKNELSDIATIVGENTIDIQKLEAVSPPLIEDCDALQTDNKNEAQRSTRYSTLPSIVHNRPPNTSRRVIVEEISVVTTTSSLTPESKFSSRVKTNNKTNTNIPSLIDNIIEKPLAEPSLHKQRLEKRHYTSQEKKDQRRTLINSSFADPWERQNSQSSNATDRHKDRRLITDSHKRRRHSSSSSSSSGGADGRQQSYRHHQEGNTEKHHHTQLNRYQNHRGREQHEGTELKSRQLHNLKRRQSSEDKEWRRHSTNENDIANQIKKRQKMESEASSISSKSTPIKKSPVLNKSMIGVPNESVRKTDLPAAKRKRSFSSSSSSSNSTISTQKGTLGALLTTTLPKIDGQPKQQTGPKTPPDEEECRASQGSSISSTTENRRRNHDSSQNCRSTDQSLCHAFERRTSFHSEGRNQRVKNFTSTNHEKQAVAQRFFNEDNNDAPAAYRMSRQFSVNQKIDVNNKKPKVTDRSSSSSSTSSTSSRSDSSCSTKERKQIKKIILKDNKMLVSKHFDGNNSPITATICSSQRGAKTPTPPPPNEEKMDSISSAESNDELEQHVEGMNDRQQVTHPKEDEKQTAELSTVVIDRAKSNHEEIADNSTENFVTSFVEIDEQNSTIIKSMGKVEMKGEQQSCSGNNIDQKTKKRASREELLRKLQSVEEAIARKKQLKEVESAPVGRID